MADIEKRLDERDRQQLQAPLDDVSKAVIGAAIGNGAGSSPLTQTISTSGSTANVPAAYVGTRFLEVDGVQYEVPYISKV